MKAFDDWINERKFYLNSFQLINLNFVCILMSEIRKKNGEETKKKENLTNAKTIINHVNIVDDD